MRRQRQTTNPYSSGRRSSSRRPTFTMSNLTAIGSVFLTLTLWFTSPLSDAIANFVLMTVPLESDVELGLSTWNQDMKFKYPLVYDAWNVGEIGAELVQGRAMKSFCRRKGSNVDSETCANQIQLYPWSFRVVHSDQVNAFALPGGIICVTDSLLKTLNLTRGEIAALLGHEIGHVLHRHSQAQLMKQDLLLTIVNAILSHMNPEHSHQAPNRSHSRGPSFDARAGQEESFGDAVGDLLFQGMQFLGEMKFSRANEYEADTAAWELLVSSNNYDPRNVQNLLQKLWSLERGNGKTSWEMTHPGTADRMEALQAKWESSQRGFRYER